MAANTTYPVGSSQTVVWTGATGANGHSTIAGGANVDILFSADNGATWSTLLAGTTNDGSQAVTLPSGVAAPFARVARRNFVRAHRSVGRARAQRHRSRFCS